MPSKKPFALAVDDEPADLENLRHVLANAGYRVFTASDAKRAMEIFQRHADQIKVLVTDVAMSPVGGFDLAAALVKLKPDLHVTFVSAYSGSLAFQYSEVLTFPFALVAKPFSAQDLLAKIRPETEKVRHAGSGESTEA